MNQSAFAGQSLVCDRGHGGDALLCSKSKTKEKYKNTAITSVGALDGDCFSVTLTSGHTILLEFEDRINEPVFAALIERGVFDKPKTDGKRLYWPDGPSFTIAEIFEMLAGD